MQQALDRYVGDAGGGDDDQRALQPTGEIFGFGMAVGMHVVGGPRGHRQRPDRAGGRDQIHDRLCRVREEAHRAGEGEGAELERHGEQCGAQ